MNAIIQQFQNELNPEERRLFEADARLAGRRPGAHLKAVLFAGRARSPGLAVEGPRPLRPGPRLPAQRPGAASR